MAKTFFIVDGHAQIYRAYYAPFRELTSASGEPTKATFVFVQRLLNLIELRKPDYLAMVIDSGDAELHRKTIYPEYKANRKPPPDDFKPQEQRILQIVRDMGLPIYAMPGFEADDLIATMAHQLCNKGYETIIVSNDKDIRQLVNDCTKMYDAFTDTVIDAAAIEAKCGYTPKQAIDIQTLMGDAIDHVPGIPGIGEKTAAKLIHKYGRAEAIMDHLDELTPKMRENFISHGPLMGRARSLVTLHTDVPFEFDIADCEFQGVNQEALRSHLSHLGFHSLIKRLDEASGKIATPAPGPVKKGKDPYNGGLFGGGDDLPTDAPPAMETCKDCAYTVVQTPEAFSAFVNQLKQQKRFAFDTETDALGAMNSKLVGLSFSWKEKTGFYVPLQGPSGSQHLDEAKVLEALKPIYEDPTFEKVGHNVKYDVAVLKQAGVNVRGVVLDSMIAAFLLDASRMQFGIDRLAMDFLNFKKVTTEELIGKGKMQLSMALVDIGLIGSYASEDADVTWRLCELFDNKLTEIPQLRKLSDEMETPLIDVLVEMESNGIAVDPAVLKEQSGVLAERIDILRGRICKEASFEFNCDSPKQLADVLYTRLKLPVHKRTKTGPSTDMEALDKLAHLHPVPKLIQDYRGLVKLKNTYLDNLTAYIHPTTKRIHAHFNQIGAATGRLSCSDPNMQNIPIRTDEGRRIRMAFVTGDPEKNTLLTADYSQIELRVLAHFAQEQALMRAFEADQDIHSIVAAEVFGVAPDQVTKDQRAQAKVINFGIVYGVSAYGLSWRIEGLTVQGAAELIKAYNKRFPAIHQFLDRCVVDAQTQGYVETIMGRRRPIPEISSGVINLRNQGERQAINSVVQGSAADLIKIAMLNIHRRLKRENRRSRMLLQVHDELVFETPKEVMEDDAAMIKEEMVGAIKLRVPLKVEMGWGRNWQEVK